MHMSKLRMILILIVVVLHHSSAKMSHEDSDCPTSFFNKTFP